MEPCAPGTEDESPIMYATLNKQENEQERLLNQKAVLRNGKYKNVFELSYVNGAEHWFCNVCQCPVMGRVFQHENGRRHSVNLYSTNKHSDKQIKDEKSSDASVSIDIAPGEPVPPGFEEEVGRVAQIQERLDGFKVGPLVALEYLVELQDHVDTTKEPFYLCVLCDKRGDPRTVLTHLASYNHISQYLQRHFPTCYRALAPYMTKQYKRNWQITLQKIAEAIEKKFGRLKPFPIEKDKFDKERMHFLQMIVKGRHFSEVSGWSFEELIVHDELTRSHEDEKLDSYTSWNSQPSGDKSSTKRSPSPPVVACPSKRPKPGSFAPFMRSGANGQSSSGSGPQKDRRRSLSSLSSVSSSDVSDKEEQQVGMRVKRKTPPFQKGRGTTYERRRSISPRRKSPILRRRSPLRRSPTRRDKEPWQNPTYQKQKDDFVGNKPPEKSMEKLRKIEEFRKLARAIENDMFRMLKQHEKNPEKHPQYNDEWKKFWNKRYKELQTEGVDVTKHDFKPEWIQYWNKRLQEIHNEELKTKKDALRKRLGLPDEPTPIKFKIGAPLATKAPTPKDPNKPNLPMAAQPDQDNEVIIIDDKDEEESKAMRRRSRSQSPWETEISPKNIKLRIKRSRSSSRSRINRSYKSPRRSRERSPLKDKQKQSISMERKMARSKSRDRVLNSKDRSKSRDRSRSKEKTKVKELRSHSRELRSLSRERRDKKGDKKRFYRESSYERDLRGKERVRTVADLPWEREKVYRYPSYESFYKPPPVMRDVTRKPVLNMPVNLMVPPEDIGDDGEVNVVDVLRILTALEERLGSLGPKIIDLLALALAMEKKEANSSEKLLDSDVNCVLFETVKEKLKGQLLAGLVDIVQERAFKKAIKKTASLIHSAGQRKSQRDKVSLKVMPVTVPGVGTVDKAAIAKQIATALIMQGKTDVTQAELEQLINAVVGMAEASKNTNKPMTTANFLQQISSGEALLGLSESQKKLEPEEKIIIPTSYKKSELVNLEKLTEPLTPSPGKNSSANMENLSDSDLQTLLQNFKDLSTDEQHNLINYLKKLEAHEPERVERLRKFVNLDPNSDSKVKNENKEEPEQKKESGRDSPFSERHGAVNPAQEENLVKIESEEEEMEDISPQRNDDEKDKPHDDTKVNIDSEEEEDYTFEDVVKAVSKNVKDKELEDNMKIVEKSMKFESDKIKSNSEGLSDAKSLISNLMSTINKTVASDSNSIDLLGLGVSSSGSAATSNILTSTTTDFAKTLSTINMASLASIMDNAQKMKTESSADRQLNFEPPRAQVGKLNFDPSQLSKPLSPSDFNSFNSKDQYLEEAKGSFYGGSFKNTGPGSMDRGYGDQRFAQRNAGPNQVPMSNFGNRERSVPYQPQPFSGGNMGSALSSQQQNVQYPNARAQRPDAFDIRNRYDNQRFSGNYANQYGNNRPNSQGNNYNNSNRW